jgi:hypothetical protein
MLYTRIVRSLDLNASNAVFLEHHEEWSKTIRISTEVRHAAKADQKIILAGFFLPRQRQAFGLSRNAGRKRGIDHRLCLGHDAL